jgi:hypothetical protein
VDPVGEAVWGADELSAIARTQLLSSESGKAYLLELDEMFRKG